MLEVLAGVRTPPQAATAIGLSLAGYYQLEARALHGLLEACVPKPKGRQPNPAKASVTLAALEPNSRMRWSRPTRSAMSASTLGAAGGTTATSSVSPTIDAAPSGGLGC